MSVILKKDTWKIKDPNTGEYRDSTVFSSTFAQDATDIVADATAAIDAQEIRVAGIVSDAQNDIDTIAAAVQSMTQTGTDTTLSVSGAAADAAAVGDELSELKTAITQIENNTYLYKEHGGEFTSGKFVYTNYEVGATLNPDNKTSNSSYCYIILPVTAWHKYYVTATTESGTSKRAVVLTDSNYKVILRSVNGANQENRLYIPKENGYLIVNAKKASTYKLTESFFADGEYCKTQTKITDPYQLSWAYGSFSSSETITKDRHGAFTTERIVIKAGSIISVKNSNIHVSAYLEDINTGDVRYVNVSPNSDDILVLTDASARIQVQLADASNINNLALLDNVYLSLIIDDKNVPAEPFVRKSIMYDNVPFSNYSGKHTDTTGFDQTTEYATALAKWRELPSLASGYITETDLGAIYTDGSHQYLYKFVPAYKRLAGKKIPHVFIVTSLHGHEKSATYGLRYLIDDMLNHAEEDPVLWYLRNNVRFTIMPMANPYGWDANSSLGTHGGIRYNENGVNLNRNFGCTTWSNYDSDPDYTTPGEYNYRGTAPFSEIETQRIRDALVDTANDISLIVDIHTYGTDTDSYVSITYTGANQSSSEAMKQLYQAFDQYLMWVQPNMIINYEVPLGYSTVYGSSSIDATVDLCLKDYGFDAYQIPSMTLEVPCGSSSDYLGTNLTKYSPDLIKLCGEMIGNMICKALYDIGQVSE